MKKHLFVIVALVTLCAPASVEAAASAARRALPTLSRAALMPRTVTLKPVTTESPYTATMFEQERAEERQKMELLAKAREYLFHANEFALNRVYKRNIPQWFVEQFKALEEGMGNTGAENLDDRIRKYIDLASDFEELGREAARYKAALRSFELAAQTRR